MKVAALFVTTGGIYFGRDDIDPWDVKRDARLYDGPYPVVAHPPCSRWCRLAGLVEARWGHKKGDDGGCFASALASVRKFGGVLEHPAYSDAWRAHDLLEPPTGAGWVNADFFGGWTCYVEQHRYGHDAKKATWLYACKVDLPSLAWGLMLDKKATALVSWCGNKIARGERRPRLAKKKSIATPPSFQEALIALAKTAVRA